MSATAPPLRESRRRYWWAVVIFLLGVLVGWLLAPHGKSCAGGTAGAAAGGGAKFDGGAGEGKLGSGPRQDAQGMPPEGAGGGKPTPGYDAVGGKLKYADEPSAPGNQHSKPVEGDGPESPGVPDPPGGKILKASDFRYDRTGLPRYAQSVSATASTLSHDIGSTAYHTTAAIISTSRFEDVVEWYKAQLPAGWNAQVVGNVGALAQQVSMDNILKTLTAATEDKGAVPGAAAPDALPTGAPAGALNIAMFSPPPHSVGDPSIIVQQGADKTIQITMSRNGTDP
jgi:hypothetical protein